MELAIPDPLCPSPCPSTPPTNTTSYSNGFDSADVSVMNADTSCCDEDRNRDGDVSKILVGVEGSSEPNPISNIGSGSSSSGSGSGSNGSSGSQADIACVTPTADRKQRQQEQGSEQGQGQGSDQGQGQWSDQGQGQGQGQGSDQSPGSVGSNSDSDTRRGSDRSPHPSPPPHPHLHPLAYGDQDAVRRLGDWLREQEASEDALSLLQQDGWMR